MLVLEFWQGALGRSFYLIPIHVLNARNGEDLSAIRSFVHHEAKEEVWGRLSVTY